MEILKAEEISVSVNGRGLLMIRSNDHEADMPKTIYLTPEQALLLMEFIAVNEKNMLDQFKSSHDMRCQKLSCPIFGSALGEEDGDA